MGQSGLLIFFTTRKPENAPGVLRRLIEYAQRPHLGEAQSFVVSARAQNTPDRSWDDFTEARLQDEFVLPNLPPPLPKPWTEEAVLAAFHEEGYLRFEIIHGVAGHRIWQAIETSIPESIRDRFAPGGFLIRAGWHDIFETTEHEEGHLFGRAFLSISFFSYGTPNDWKECRRMILENPEVQAVKRELEEIAGPLEQCVYWSV